MKKAFLLFGVLLFTGMLANAQTGVAINTTGAEPDNSAMLDVSSTDKGFLLPRMTFEQMKVITSPANGLMIFCTDCGPDGLGSMAFNSNGVWYYFDANRIIPLPPVQGTHVSARYEIVWNWNASAEATGYKWSSIDNFETATDLGNVTTKTETGLDCETNFTKYIWAYNNFGHSGSATFSQATSVCIVCGEVLTDVRDGKNYNTLQLGTQCWIVQNLNIGTRISGSSSQTNNGTIEKFCYYDDEANCDVYGGLYQWDEMMNYTTTAGVQGICPPNGGWHLPTDEEWTTMTNYVKSQAAYLCQSTTIAKSLAATTNWQTNMLACTPGRSLATNNATGFTGLPGGSWVNGGNGWSDITNEAIWWSSSVTNPDTWVWYRSLHSNNTGVSRGSRTRPNALSVRCLKN